MVTSSLLPWDCNKELTASLTRAVEPSFIMQRRDAGKLRAKKLLLSFPPFFGLKVHPGTLRSASKYIVGGGEEERGFLMEEIN